MTVHKAAGFAVTHIRADYTLGHGFSVNASVNNLFDTSNMPTVKGLLKKVAISGQVSSIRSDVKADSGICIAIRLMKILFSSQEAEYAQEIAPTTATEAVQIKTADGAANAKHGRQPAADHRTDYPKNTGQENPPPSRPGMISLAIMPAIRPK